MENNVAFRRFGTMLDCSRNAVMNVPSVKRWVDIISDLGYNTLLLYIEDTYEIEGEPYFGYLRGRYTKAEMKEIDDYAYQKGVEVIPCIQTLAHLEAIFRWHEYRGIHDTEDIILAGSERTYKLIEGMFETASECFRTDTINIGMDEAEGLGRGRYMNIHGYKSSAEILPEHLARISDIAKKHGKKLIMWSDMFFKMASGGQYYVKDFDVTDEIRNAIPDNVSLIYWDYYSTDKKRYDSMLEAHMQIKEDTWFAGGYWTWPGFAPHNTYSFASTRASVTSCLEHGTKDVFFTMWGDYGSECSKFSMLPTLYFGSELAKGNSDFDKIKQGFYEKYGIGFDDFMLLDLPCTANASGEYVNPEKYMLYNDCFLGIYDSVVSGGEGDAYLECAKKLSRFENNEKWGYLFSTMRTLCEVLSLKFELGARTKSAYDKKDREALSEIAEDYGKVLEKLPAFYSAFEYQWFFENKPHGFDAQDLRLGGLIQRLKHCRARLADYINGKTDRIEELEETRLDAFGGKEELSKKHRMIREWPLIASVNDI